MPSRTENEIQAGLDHLRRSLARANLDLIEQRPLDNWLTYIVIGQSNNRTDIVLGRNFICDLPASREYQDAVDSYLSAVAGRVRCGDPNAFYCLSGIAIRTATIWPARPSPSGAQWLIVNIYDQSEGSVAMCTTPVASGPTFVQLRDITNRLRKSIDEKAIKFFKPQEHPLNYQHVLQAGPEASARPETEIQRFLLAKAYCLGFQSVPGVGQIWIADPWDAEYLNISVTQLAKAAQVLQARDLLDIAPSGAFARPSKNLIAMGGPVGLGSAAEHSKVQPSLAYLPRKETLLEDLRNLLSSGAELALVFVDLDEFKAVNDTKGHPAGDSCLERIVNIMAGVVGQKGSLYRCGGDEFAILLPDFSTEEAHVTAERIRRAVENAKPGEDVHVTTSIGICGTDRIDGATPQILYKASDDAMYESKRCGKNRVTTWPTSERKASAAAPSG